MYKLFIPNNQKAVKWLSFGHLINDIYTGFMNPLMPILAAKLEFTIVTATIVISVSHIFSSLLQPVFGFFADNLKKRFFIFWGLLFTSIFIPLSVLAPNIFVLTIFVVAGSLGSSFFHPQALGLFPVFLKEKTSSGVAFFVSAGTFGFAFGPVLAGAITNFLGLDFVAYTGFLGVLTAFFMFCFVPKNANRIICTKKQNFFVVLKKILSNTNIVILIILSAFKSIITNSCSVLLPFLWHAKGHNAAFIGFCLFSFIFCGGLGSFFSAKIENLIGAKNVFYLSLITMFPLMLIFVFLLDTSFYFYYPIFCIMGFLTMLAIPVNIVMAQKIMPEYKSLLSGFINGFSWGASAVLLTVLGFLAQKFGIKQVLLVVSLLPLFFSYFVKFLPDFQTNDFK